MKSGVPTTASANPYFPAVRVLLLAKDAQVVVDARVQALHARHDGERFGRGEPLAPQPLGHRDEAVAGDEQEQHRRRRAVGRRGVGLAALFTSRYFAVRTRVSRRQPAPVWSMYLQCNPSVHIVTLLQLSMGLTVCPQCTRYTRCIQHFTHSL